MEPVTTPELDARIHAWGEQRFADGAASRQPEVDRLKALLRPAGPAPLLFAYTAVPGPEWERSDVLVVTGRSNYGHDAFKRVHDAGGKVALYIDALIDNPEGEYHQLLHNGLKPWKPAMVNGWGRLADFRVGSLLQLRFRDVLQRAVKENPHIDGFFADDLGSRPWFTNLRSENLNLDERASYRAGAIGLAKTFRDVADRHGLFVIGNGTWTGGNGGGYPVTAQTGCSLLDGMVFEGHDPAQAYVKAQATAPQWAGDRDPMVLATAKTKAEREAWQRSGVAAYVNQQASYDVAPAPW